ncbi:hypothetical protein Tco_1083912, partial [Tanacetum coccineum]
MILDPLLTGLTSAKALTHILHFLHKAKDKLNYLELLIPVAPVPAVDVPQVPPETIEAHAAWVKGQKKIVVLMLMTMEPDLQRNL